MRVCFADTAYYVALVSPHDEAHAIATRFAASYDGRIITTSAVLTEVGGHLSAPPNRPAFLRVVQHVQSDPGVQLVHIDRGIFRKGLELFQERADKERSLTDCTSFIVMHRHKLKDALTTDHHDEQAGFRVLLREDTQ